jgi:hypothetical protein
MSWHFIHISWGTMQNYIFDDFFTCILNWELPIFFVFWLNTLFQKTFSAMMGKSGRKYLFCKEEAPGNSAY